MPARKSCQVVSSRVKSCQTSKKLCQAGMSRIRSTVKSCQAMQTTPKRLVRGWLPPTPPPIDESRSGPARSAVKQAKTHLEQEAELAIMHAKKKTYSLPRRAEPTCIAKLPPTLGKGVGRRSPWKSLGKERKPSAKGVTPSVKGVTIRKWAYDLGKRGQLQQKKGHASEQKGTEARRELTELCRETAGLGRQKSPNHPQK